MNIEPVHEVLCPECGATIRARMADHPDLVREVARLWRESKKLAETDADMRDKGREMEVALDRLTAAWGSP